MPKMARDAPRQAFGPTTNGRATNPAHPARPPGPHLARDAAEPSRPLDLIRRPAATLAGSKPATPVFPETLATLSPSPFSLHATQRRRPLAMVAGRSGRDGAAAACSPAHALESRKRNPGVPERRAGGSTVPRSPASGGASASHAPATAVVRGPGRSRAL